ncbi:uncharacterized protein LOC126204041 [Schistocerca nitens]|uniref:uncharacterized protein LOC126204041 n=1 Tax=Schistocerca nitens TaxID=7011 RepID=UPI0021194CA7|nr:uncharacterized protein LOC126204041 [Schistocerca nitens]
MLKVEAEKETNRPTVTADYNVTRGPEFKLLITNDFIEKPISDQGGAVRGGGERELTNSRGTFAAAAATAAAVPSSGSVARLITGGARAEGSSIARRGALPPPPPSPAPDARARSPGRRPVPGRPPRRHLPPPATATPPPAGETRRPRPRRPQPPPTAPDANAWRVATASGDDALSARQYGGVIHHDWICQQQPLEASLDRVGQCASHPARFAADDPSATSGTLPSARRPPQRTRSSARGG